MRRALVVLAMSCGGSIAPVDTFNDAPLPVKPTDGGPTQDSFTWHALAFTTESKPYSDCGGKKYVRPALSYDVWVGVELCSPSRYKIYLSSVRQGPYYEVADLAGNGQDHCELVNPKFTIANEDEISSGNCKLCDLGPAEPRLAPHPGVSVFDRAHFGEPFAFDAWPRNAHTSRWYECGVSIP